MTSALRVVLAATSLATAAPAPAETPAEVDTAETPTAAPSGAAPAVEEILVTGTRIPRASLDAGVPFTVVGEEEIRRTATLNAEDVIRDLPMAQPGVTPFTNNGNPGAATVNLRGLDDERSLVLVDGKRFVGYDSEGIVDLNNIPTPLIERIEVVTGGASSTYGSDAIAGVVNFVLKRDFEGVLLGGTYGITGRGDGSAYDLNATLGRNFADERGNLTVFLGWTDRSELSAAERPFGEAPLSPMTGEVTGSLDDTNGNFFCEPQCQEPGSFPPQSLVGFTPSRGLGPVVRTFNFSPYNLLQVPEERVQSTAIGRFDVAEWIALYARATLARTVLETEQAPAGTFGTEFAFPLDNPYWTAQALRVFSDRDADGLLDQLEVNGIPGFQPADFMGPSGEPGDQGDVGTTACPACAGNGVADPGESIRAPFARRMAEVGPRLARYETLAYQVVTGLRGDIPGLDGWSWDLSYQYGRTDLSRSFRNDVSSPRIQDMLDGCPPDAAPGCVAGNLFGEGTLSAAAADFIALDLTEGVETDQQVVSASASGHLGESLAIPGAAPVGIALGVEWRRETSASFPSDCYATPGCSPGFGSVTPVRADYDVEEVFGELLVPLLERRRLAHALNFEAGVRFADYSTIGGALAFKLGGSYAPIETLRLRAMFQRAVRAPNIYEFGSPILPSRAFALGDPCAAFNEATGNTTVSAELRDLCVATGAPASAFTPLSSGDYTTAVPDVIAFELNAFLGGNPELEEEEADTLTLGFVYEPDWAIEAGLRLDWYRIEVEDAISPIVPGDVLAGCYDGELNPSRDPDNRLCELLRRSSLTGGLVGGLNVGIIATEQNLAMREVEGIDLQVRVVPELGRWGRLEILLLSSYLMRRDERVATDFPGTHCQGRYGDRCGAPSPSVRFTQETIWTLGDWSGGYRWRFLAATEIDEALADLDGDGVPDPLCLERFCSIAAAHYVDLHVEWAPTDARLLGGFRITLGVENVFDEDPPIVGSFGPPGNANTYPDSFDPLGRTFTLSFSKKF